MALQEAKQSYMFGMTDFDLTISRPRHSGWLGKVEGSPLLKSPNKPIEGAAVGIKFLRDQDDIIFGGINTTRTKHFRPWTPRQARKLGIEPHEISYVGHSKDFRPKVLRILNLVAKLDESFPEVEFPRVFLIDDKAGKTREAAIKLSKNPKYKELMRKYNFTLIAYNPKPETNLEEVRADDGTLVMTVIPMNNWEKESLEQAIQQLRQTPTAV